MVNLKEKIKIEFKEAFKAKSELKLSVLKMLNSEIANAEISKRTKLVKSGQTADLAASSELGDNEILEVIGREIKKRKDAAEMYEKGNRKDLAEKERQEEQILYSYMPPQMTEEDIKILVKEAIKQSGAKNQKEIGKVMALLMPQVKGKADSSLVVKIVKEELS